MCVSCDLLLHSCPSSLRPFFVLRSFRAVPRDRELPHVLSRFLFYMIEDTFLLFRVLFYVIEDVLFPYSTFYLNIEDGDCMCMCICMCVHPCRWILSAGLSRFFSLSFRERVYTESLVTQAERTRPLENSTSLWLLHPYFFFCYYNPAPRRSRSSLDSSVVSLRCFSPLARRSSGFNFVHFCFLNYLLVSSIRDGDSSTFVGFYFLVYSLL